MRLNASSRKKAILKCRKTNTVTTANPTLTARKRRFGRTESAHPKRIAKRAAQNAGFCDDWVLSPRVELQATKMAQAAIPRGRT